MHFLQTEYWSVLSGKVGISITPRAGSIGALIDHVLTPACTSRRPFVINTWTPHTIWPAPDAQEDTTGLLWASPEGPYPPMLGADIFLPMMQLMSDISEGKYKADMLQLMLNG